MMEPRCLMTRLLAAHHPCAARVILRVGPVQLCVHALLSLTSCVAPSPVSAQQSFTGPVQVEESRNPDGRMNVLLIVTDDLRSESSLFDKATMTPNLERLAKRGIVFDRAYSQVGFMRWTSLFDLVSCLFLPCRVGAH